MNINSPHFDDEIDLIKLLRIIWNGKIKILLFTTISFLIGFYYSYQIPNNYLSSLTVEKKNTLESLKLNNFNLLLQSNNSINLNQNYQLENSDSNQFNPLNLKKFIDEIKDYEEFLSVIKKTKKFEKETSNLSNEAADIKLYDYIKLLEIPELKENESISKLNLTWHDPEEAKRILQETLNLSLINFKKKIISEFEELLDFEKKSKLSKDLERIVYLTEQSNIAKELKIQDSQINNLSLSQSSLSLNINTANIPYYLRGYQAIDKEIDLIKNRKYQHLNLLEQEIISLKTFKIDFLSYNVYLTETKSLKNTKFIVISSILLGLIIGFSYVLLLNAFQSQKPKK